MVCFSFFRGRWNPPSRPNAARPRPPRGRRLWLEALERRDLLATFLVTNTNDSGSGSLRQALFTASINPGPDIIAFNINGGGQAVINLTSAGLPLITDPVMIDGTTQPGYAGTPLIRLDGAALPGNSATGLALGSGNSTVRGLSITHFAYGIVIFGPGNNLVTGNYLGVALDGVTAAGNTATGIDISSSANNVIGGTTAAMRNLLSGNGVGVSLNGTGATGNTIAGNYIGLDVNGGALGNKGSSFGFGGVLLFGGAHGNQIGTFGGGGNVISANTGSGVVLEQTGTDNNQVFDNRIGTDPTGMAARPNTAGGILLLQVVGNQIGDAFGDGNLISGNNGPGVSLSFAGTTGNVLQGNTIGLNATGGYLPNHGDGVDITSGSANNQVIAAGSGNFIGGNDGYGVFISDPGTTGNVVYGNYIGLDFSGSLARANGAGGVLIQHGATGNRIGNDHQGNFISGNANNGVLINDVGTTGNYVQGNYIGTNALGTAGVPNGNDGVLIHLGASGNFIGGASRKDNVTGKLSGLGNVISANPNAGVSLSQTTGNLVQGNYIGTDASGMQPLGNDLTGFGLDAVALTDGAADNLIGGPSQVDGNGNLSGLGNLISGNGFDGVYLAAQFAPLNPATRNRIEGNFIGTDVTGTVTLVNHGYGVHLEGGAVANTVGGADPGTGNLISGNSGSGVLIADFAATGPVTQNLVEGNTVGLDYYGRYALGNLLGGVMLQHGATGNQVGAAGAGNLIAGNPGSGILITDAATTGNLVFANTIGLNAAGTALPVTATGITVQQGANHNQIGRSGAGNVISGAAQYGVVLSGAGTADNIVQGNDIGTDTSGTAARPNGLGGVLIQQGAANNRLGGAGQGNVISGNGVLNPNGGNLSALAGVVLTDPGTTGNILEDNFIGTDASGHVALGNLNAGVVIRNGASTNQVRRAVQGNVISGNVTLFGQVGGNGVVITDPGTIGNVVAGNLIGTDVTGTQPLGNGLKDLGDLTPFNVPAMVGVGVVVFNADLNQIGTAAGAPNVIAGNPSRQIYILAGSRNTVVNNYIGIDASGHAAVSNAQSQATVGDGIVIAGAGDHNQIGRAGQPNVISGNLNGVILRDSTVTANFVEGNLIGTDVSGTKVVGNLNGVEVELGANHNLIGANGQGNVISGNRSTGVFLALGASNNSVEANFIGTDVDGKQGLGNGAGGVVITRGAFANQVGAPGAGNVISGNAGDGVWIFRQGDDANSVQGNLIGTAADGTTPLGNGGYGVKLGDDASTVAANPGLRSGVSGNTVGGINPGEGNVIAANALGGIYANQNGLPAGVISAYRAEGGAGDSIFGVENGLNTGTITVGNPGTAVNVTYAPGKDGQAFQFNGTNSSVSIPDSPSLKPAAITVSAFAEFTALDTPNAAIPGLQYLVFKQNSRTGQFEGYALYKLRINGTDRFVFQVTAKDGTSALAFSTTTVVTGQFYHVAGSYDGTTAKIYVNGVLAGTAQGGFALNYGTNPVFFGTSGQSFFDGKFAGLLDEVSLYNRALTDTEVFFLATAEGTGENLIYGNSIGTDAADKLDLHNGGDGVRIQDSNFNFVGEGNDPSSSNYIAFNQGDGVHVTGAQATYNTVYRNYIGTDINLSARQGNRLAGVQVEQAASQNSIYTNRIAFNGREGVEIGTNTNDNALNNVLLYNHIFGNGLGGIDLGNIGSSQVLPGVHAAGPNRLQNPPMLADAGASTNYTSVNVFVAGLPGVTYAVEVFANTALDKDGSGEGEQPLFVNGVGFTDVTTNAQGFAFATLTFPVNLSGKYLTATVTSFGGFGDTSPFATPVLVGPLVVAGAGGHIGSVFTVVNTNDGGPGSLRQAIIDANNNPGLDLINFNIPGPGPYVIGLTSDALPQVTDPVVIDATTQLGFGPSGRPVVQLDGGNLHSPDTHISGLDLTAGGSIVRGLSVTHFENAGIQIDGPGSNLVEGDWLGVDATGQAAGNHQFGVEINHSTGNVVGGTTAAARNVISGNPGAGVFLQYGDTTGNYVQGNWLGLAPDGITPYFQNGGVELAAGASNNIIGGSVEAGNVMAGDADGVRIHDPHTTGNIISGNHIGTDSTGTKPVGNGGGVVIYAGASGNHVGYGGIGNVIVFNGTGVFLSDKGTDDNDIGNNLIGLLDDGSALANLGDGVLIENGAGANLVGGAAGRNVISGNDGYGVDITGQGTANNRVLGNYLGTDVMGVTARPNAKGGVIIQAGASNNQVGTAGAGNVISGNGLFNSVGGSLVALGGVVLTDPGTTGNILEDNLIGTDATGRVALGNLNAGVIIRNGASANQVRRGSQGNVLSGNTSLPDGTGGNGVVLTDAGTTGNLVTGNLIGTDVSGAQPLGNGQLDPAASTPFAEPTATGVGIAILNNAASNQIGTPGGAPNVIAGNPSYQVFLEGTANNTLVNNYVGTNASGTAALVPGTPAGGGGAGLVLAAAATGNQIGLAGQPNVISGNATGVLLRDGGVTSNRVQGNRIGTDVTGTKAVGNVDGVVIELGANGNTLGGQGGGNVISGNRAGGVVLTFGAFNNQVSANFIGTDGTGTQPLGNGTDGVLLAQGASSNQVGLAGLGNVIAANGGSGVAMVGQGTSVNHVQGNWIGTGTADQLDLGNAGDGVRLSNANNNLVGDASDPAASNFIAFNHGNGVHLTGAQANFNNILRNYIGTDINLTAHLGNRLAGVFVEQGASTNEIYTNRIAFNGRQGVRVGTDLSDSLNTVPILDNFIFGNALGGIDLGGDGATLNTPGAHASGPNHLQNHPVLSDAGSVGSFTSVHVFLDGAPNTNYSVQVFANSGLDRDGSAQGEQPLSVNGKRLFLVTTNGQGFAFQTLTFPVNLLGKYLTATATLTDQTDTFVFDTSEFSAPVAVGPLLVAGARNQISSVFTVVNTNDSGPGSLRQAVLDANNVAGLDLINFNIPGTAPYVIHLTSDALPQVTDPVVIDATTQLGFGPSGRPVVQLDGGNLHSPDTHISGLDLTAGGSIVRGLSVTHFENAGIQIDGPGSNLVEGNWLGVDATGQAAGNRFGVEINHSAGNVVGGTTAAARNVLAGNAAGVELRFGDTTGNSVEGNWIGLGPDGLTPFFQLGGVDLSAGAANNSIGGPAGAGNIISGNTDGVLIHDPHTTGNVVWGNHIGTDSTGEHAVGNLTGVLINNGASLNHVGAGGVGNVIAGNFGPGVSLADNGTTGNDLGNNLIGLLDDGSALPNQGDGIFIASGASANVVGGVAGRNVISGNGGYGVDIAGMGTTGNRVLGNYIGTDVSGSAARPNAAGGVIIQSGAANNQIGAAGAGNVISGNGALNPTGDSLLAQDLRQIGLALLQYSQDFDEHFPWSPTDTHFHSPMGLSWRVAILPYLGLGSLFSQFDLTKPWDDPVNLPLLSQMPDVFRGPGDSPGTTTTRFAGVAGDPLTLFGLPGGQGQSLSGIVSPANNLAVGEVFGSAIPWTKPADVDIGQFPTLGVPGGFASLLPGVVPFLFSDGHVKDVSISTDPGTLSAMFHIDNLPHGGVVPGPMSPTVRGLGGVVLTGAGTSGNILEDNWIGTDATGRVALGNLNAGVIISDGASGNQVRRGTQGNVISGNLTLSSQVGGNGIVMTDVGTSGNVVTGNLIGTDVSGTLPLGNGSVDQNGFLFSVPRAIGVGVVVTNGAVDNPIGASGGAPNVIAGNPSEQVLLLETTFNTLVNNYVGTNASGRAALAAASNVPGIVLAGDATSNVIGLSGQPNVISGNSFGVVLVGPGVMNNKVQGNLIGTDVSGTMAVGNIDGIFVHLGANHNVFGGRGEGNVISGNRSHGVFLNTAVSDNEVSANLIGTDATGQRPLGNGLNGVLVLRGAHHNQIGRPGRGNVISANGSDGIALDRLGTDDNAIQGNLIGTTADGLTALGNLGYGVRVSLSESSLQAGERTGASGNTIGGINPGEGNVIAGNALGGIVINQNGLPTGVISYYAAEGGAGDGVQTVVNGTTPGNPGTATNITYAPGKFGQAFQFDGTDSSVAIPDSPSLKPAAITVSAFAEFTALDTPNASAPGLQYLVFKQNSRTGRFEGYALIKLRLNGVDRFVFQVTSQDGTLRASAVSTTAVTTGQFYHVAGSYDGQTAKIYVNGVLENSAQGGFALDYGTNPLFFGTSGQSFDGKFAGLLDEVSLYNRALTDSEVFFLATANGTGENLIYGNAIGTDAADKLDLHNGGDGVLIQDSNANQVGEGNDPSSSNYIAFNLGDGVHLTGSQATYNTVYRNYVGTDITESAQLGNRLAGVHVEQGASNSTIFTNRIAFNGRQGVLIGADTGDNAVGNALLYNRIFGNGLVGIDLGNFTTSAVSFGVHTSGPNHLQNPPVLTGAGSSGAFTSVHVGIFAGLPNTTYAVEVFANSGLRPDGSAQGEQPIFLNGNGFADVTTNAQGNAAATLFFFVNLRGKYLTATTTRLDGNGNAIETSEFSTPVAVGPLVAAIFSVTPDVATEAVHTLTVSGQDFAFNAVVYLNGTALATSFNANGGLVATVPPGLAEEGVAQSVTVVNPGTEGGTSNTFSFTVADAPLDPAPVAIGATEGVAINPIVAFFSDEGGLEPAANYSALINWGDGGSSQATFTRFDGVLNVLGSHTYLVAGTYPVNVTIFDEGGTALVGTTATATVADAPLLAIGKTLSGTEGFFTQGVVASFTDADPHASSGRYKATIDWGDGATTPGTVNPDGSGFSVFGFHAYAEEGTYPITVTIQDLGTNSPNVPPATVMAHGTATVAGGVLATGLNKAIVVFGHKNFSGQVAAFSDFDSIGKAGDYSATIDWGDGSSSTGGITFAGGTQYTVSGSHTYGSFADTKQITITISEVGDPAVPPVKVTDTVVDPPFPGSTTELFVAQVYADLLGRSADAPGLTYWSGLVDHGLPRSTVVYQIEQSFEYRSDVVEGLYRQLLHRDADASGLAAFAGFLGTGGTTEQVAQIIVASGEYLQTRGGGTGDGFLDALYQDGLNRGVDSFGRAAFGQALAAGATRAQVAAAIFGSDEFRQDQVRAWFGQYLHRDADAAGLGLFAAALRGGAHDEDVLAAVLGSDEYFGSL